MTVSTDYNVSNFGNSQGSSNKSSYDLNMEDFFKLFAAQLQNQNMFDPVDNTQYIAQMAQFSTLTQMQELVSSFQSFQSLSLIGKKVHLVSQNPSGAFESISGVVKSVVYHDGAPYLEIGNQYYEATTVYKVENPPQSNSEPDESPNTPTNPPDPVDED